MKRTPWIVCLIASLSITQVVLAQEEIQIKKINPWAATIKTSTNDKQKASPPASNNKASSTQKASLEAKRLDLVLPSQDEARKVVERVYNTWRLSIMQGSVSAWRGCTSSSRQAKVRNLIVSQRGNFDSDFFRMSKTPPPALETFKYIGALAGCNKRSMAVSYLGRIKMPSGNVHPQVLVIHLIAEGNAWKYDQSSFFNLSNLPKVLKRLERKDLSILKEQDGFHPYQKLPLVPRLCGAPQLIGKVFVDCPGRIVEMKINGISPHEFYDERRADTISGGLRQGINTISYTFKDIAGESRPSMGIGLFIMPEKDELQPAVVFEHILDAQDHAKGGQFKFVIGKELLASMNPENKKAAPFRPVALKSKDKKQQPPATNSKVPSAKL